MAHGTLCAWMASLQMMQSGFVISMDLIVRRYCALWFTLSSASPLLSVDGTIVTDGSIVASDPGPYVNLSCPNYDYYRADECSIRSGNGSIPCDYTALRCFDGEGM